MSSFSNYSVSTLADGCFDDSSEEKKDSKVIPKEDASECIFGQNNDRADNKEEIKPDKDKQMEAHIIMKNQVKQEM